MPKRRCIPWLLGAALLILLPTRTKAQGAACGPFADVPATSVYCPFILQAFFNNITQGTSPTTFSPSDPISRDQATTFVTRTTDVTLHRGAIRTAIGKTWTPSSTVGGVATDVGGAVNDVVTDGTFLWVGRADGKILKINLADRRLLEIWSLASGGPRKLGVFAGQVWIADDQGRLQTFNPTGPAGSANLLFSASATGVGGGSPALAFDGTNVWLASSGASKIFIYQVSSGGGSTFNPGANIEGMVFDGTYMWVLLSNSSLLKLSIPSPGAATPAVLETLTIPGPVNDCRMVYDGNNIWIPMGGSATLYVVRPTPNLASLPSSIVKNEPIPDVLFPYVASFDGENVMIGGSGNGVVALYKATNLTRIRTFPSGAIGVLGIASDGRTFNIGDFLGTKFVQY
jgi:hypothetical protein